MQFSAQDAYAKMAQEMLANPFTWVEAWQRANETVWKAWWDEYARLMEESTKLFVKPIPF